MKQQTIDRAESLLEDVVLLQTTSPFLIVGGCSVTHVVLRCICNVNCFIVDACTYEVRPHNDRVEVLRNSLRWINVQAVLLDICIAFYPLRLPPYVILEIVDKFSFWSTHVNRKKKIDYIIRIKRFCDDLRSDCQSTQSLFSN
jgi:hypothetical protein